MTFHGYTILFSNSCGFCLSFSDIFIFLLVPYSHFFSFSSFIVLYIYFKLTIVIFIYFFHNILFLFPDHLHDGNGFLCLLWNSFFVAPIISIVITHLLFIDKKIFLQAPNFFFQIRIFLLYLWLHFYPYIKDEFFNNLLSQKQLQHY